VSFTIQQLEKLKAQGKIRDYSILNDEKSTTIKINTGGKTKEWIAMHLKAWCEGNGKTLQKEFAFHSERKWRFDFAIIEMKVAIEYEGLMSAKSRHTTVSGYTGDAEKYNAAQSLGWKVLRYTAVNYKTMIEDLNKLL
jgi:very-short-patch-repair endonuclease